MKMRQPKSKISEKKEAVVRHTQAFVSWIASSTLAATILSALNEWEKEFVKQICIHIQVYCVFT